MTPLNSGPACLNEGDELEHCMREGRYQRAAVMGRVALFSIVAEDGRSTLALEPDERERGGATRLHGWRVEQHRAARNGDPSPGCEAARDGPAGGIEPELPAPGPARGGGAPEASAGGVRPFAELQSRYLGRRGALERDPRQAAPPVRSAPSRRR